MSSVVLSIVVAPPGSGRLVDEAMLSPARPGVVGRGSELPLLSGRFGVILEDEAGIIR
jgi:hypothetical protein